MPECPLPHPPTQAFAPALKGPGPRATRLSAPRPNPDAPQLRSFLEETPRCATPPIPSAGHRPLATACWRLPARPTPSAPPPRPKPPARVSPGSPPPSRPNKAPAFPVRDSRCSTRRTHYSYEARSARDSRLPERQLRASPARRLPAPAARPWRRSTADRYLPVRPKPSAPSPRPAAPSGLGRATAPVRRHYPSRPSNSRAHDPDEHRSARGAARPHPRATPHATARPKAAPTPSQSVPQMISTAKPIVLITRTNDWRPVSWGFLEDAPHFTTLPPPRPGNPPLVPGDCPPDLLPADAPRARRSQVACATPMRQPDGTASADPRSQLRTTPTNTGRPAAPRAHTPAPRLTPQPGPKPPPPPSQSVPRMISTAKPIVLITRTNNWRPVSWGFLEDAPHFTTLPPPRPGNPPLVPGDCPPDLLPADAPRARRSQVACATPMRQPDGTASADPLSLLVRSSSVAPIKRCLEETPRCASSPSPSAGDWPLATGH